MEAFMESLLSDEAASEIYFDDLMASSTYAKPSKGLTASHLSKIWKIDLQAAQHTVEAMTQLKKHSEDPLMTRNFGTNDCMLWYKRINQFFYMDTFFASRKVANPLVEIHVAKSSLLTKDLYLLFQWGAKRMFSFLSNNL